MVLSAGGTYGPDGDAIDYHWFVYTEAGDYDGSISIEHCDAPQAHFVAPSVDSPRTNDTILEVRHDGEPGLYTYRRVSANVRPQ